MVITTLYYVFPGLVANMMPILVRKCFKSLDVPVDHGIKLGGKPLFGSHKTYRGFIFGVLGAIIIAYLQKLLYVNDIWTSIAYIDYSVVNPIILGAALGFGALFGDLIKSLVKRRVNVKPGKPFIPWDQLDYIFGIIIFCAIIEPMTIGMIITILILGPLLHIIVSRIGYYLKIRKQKW